jgi:deoxyribodipyrimidine photo-lyase
MVESLEDLNKQTKNKLIIAYGNLEDVLKNIFKNNKNIQYLSFNQDYTPYAKKRTKKVVKICKDWDIECIISEDYTLTELNEVRDGKGYSVFNPYYQRVLKMNIPKPKTNRISFSKNIKLSSTYKQNLSFATKFFDYNPELYQYPGRKEGLKILKSIKNFRDYPKVRNIPSINTTLLSGHIKYGTVSIREVYWSMVKALGKKSELVRQVIWHDFYAQLMNYLSYKQTLGGGNFQNRKIRWNRNYSFLKRWKNGTTGYPIVDAGMRQLNESGWMHNRVRLVTSNFLSVILGINWKEGEKYFAQNLVDYDPSSNNGNWQWSTQVGTDRVPYLRVYNPIKQAYDIDPTTEYIRRWVPELSSLSDEQILKWDKVNLDDIDTKINYPKPIVDFSSSFRKAKLRFKRR